MSESPFVIFMPSGRRAKVKPGQTLLDAAQEMGIAIESICGGRLTCGKCKVQIENGRFAKHGITSDQTHTTSPTADEVALLNKTGWSGRFACTTCVTGDLLVSIPEESRAQKQIIRKSASKRIIDVMPAVRQLYVKVDVAELGEHRGDWGRLQTALATQWQLKELKIDLLVLRRLQSVLRQGKWAVTVTIWQDQEVIDIQPNYQEGCYGLAIDIGSTTVAAHLCDLRTGTIIATEAMMNPQVRYGEDLMSRVSYAMMHQDGLEKMHTAIIEALNTLVVKAAQSAGIQTRQIYDAVLVGNTTMTHILLGINPLELGGAPFALANRDKMDVKARELGLRLHPAAYIHLLPAQAGHVGADNVAVLLAEAPYQQDAMILLVDIGTNAEIVLSNRQKLYSASSPTGPAFEGAQITQGMRAAPGAIERVRIDPTTKAARFRVIGEERWSNKWQLEQELAAQPQHLAAGICGSGIIEAVAEMYLTGIISADGRFRPDQNHARIRWQGRKGAYVLATESQTTSGSPILVTQDDVRNIQLAKAALYAGTKLLMKRAGISTIDRIVLAGAFGSYIDPYYAMILGLIPDCDLGQVTAIGNAAGDGARIALLNQHKRTEAQAVAYGVTYVETAVAADFQDEFVSAIHLPHAQDSFPHLANVLPTRQDVPSPRRSRRRSRKPNKKQ